MPKQSKNIRTKLRRKIIIASIAFFSVIFSVSLLIYFVWHNSNTNDDKNTPAEVANAYKEKKSSFSEQDKVKQDPAFVSVVSEEIGESETSVCYIRTDGGGGWTVKGYSQVCYDRVIVGYYTNYLREEIIDRLSSSSVVDNYNSDSKDGCKLSGDTGSTVIKYVSSGTSLSRYSENEGFNYNECGRPSSIRGLESVIGQTLGTKLSIKPIKTLDDTKIDDNRDQIWIENDYNYFEQAIVCKPAPLSILSKCDLPRSEPIQ